MDRKTDSVSVPGILGRMSPEALSELIFNIANTLVSEGKAGTLTADLIPPQLPEFEKACAQWKQQDEDVLSYALFPQVATEFFKYREAQQKKVDASVADTKNGAYPV